MKKIISILFLLITIAANAELPEYYFDCTLYDTKNKETIEGRGVIKIANMATDFGMRKILMIEFASPKNSRESSFIAYTDPDNGEVYVNEYEKTVPFEGQPGMHCRRMHIFQTDYPDGTYDAFEIYVVARDGVSKPLCITIQDYQNGKSTGKWLQIEPKGSTWLEITKIIREFKRVGKYNEWKIIE